MTDHLDNPNLHLHADPAAQEIESLLERLGQADRDAMPQGASSRILEAVSVAMVPPPISIERAQQPGHGASRPRRINFRYAAAAVLAMGTTLAIVAARPWANATQAPAKQPANEWSLASFERDFDEYLSLEAVDDGQLTEAVTEWEIWAQAVDTDIDFSMYGDDLYSPNSDDGAL